jgi:predicted TIM-barrel fold metal-dependent hydrolase
MTTMPATTPLLNLLEAWVPDEQLRQRILVDNAAVLYGFDA